MGIGELIQIHFIQSEALIEHDDYYDLYKQAKHKLCQDEMAVANKTEPVVVNKMVRNPKKFKYTSVDDSIDQGNLSSVEREQLFRGANHKGGQQPSATHKVPTRVPAFFQKDRRLHKADLQYFHCDKTNLSYLSRAQV